MTNLLFRNAYIPVLPKIVTSEHNYETKICVLRNDGSCCYGSYFYVC